MTDKQETMPDWVLIEAAKRGGFEGYAESYLRDLLEASHGAVFAALCDMILKHEQPPVDRKLACAREAALSQGGWIESAEIRAGAYDNHPHIQTAIRAIELWEEGFGK